jgi:hypothetical protein
MFQVLSGNRKINFSRSSIGESMSRGNKAPIAGRPGMNFHSCYVIWNKLMGMFHVLSGNRNADRSIGESMSRGNKAPIGEMNS